jgi:hypothetical protein
MKVDPAVLERRREALVLAAQLQRRNIAARWSTLSEFRAVRWTETIVGALSGRRHRSDARWPAVHAQRGFAGGLPWWPLIKGGIGMFSGRQATSLATTLSVLRRPTWWSVGMLGAQWLWKRRHRPVGVAPSRPAPRRPAPRRGWFK